MSCIKKNRKVLSIELQLKLYFKELIFYMYTGQWHVSFNYVYMHHGVSAVCVCVYMCNVRVCVQVCEHVLSVCMCMCTWVRYVM